ncbi:MULTISPECIES: GNAT family N-acetyltransferase [Streptomycetaceae]|uniref:N-acetyltransferase domain-containing protein n=1 Tax=Streptantibioticus cattleyicolor (strain ATCC 35852 / DSM 46488 / JCM 4925 / NBRC 14057 / NRRL 8057) TaxID=1003195 RepID=F8JR23_STREN|nr:MULTISPECIES: GNAT family N-acetyltransferase [Streptomycetaceae]AEW94112.1 hypothetical protein SCATT_17410 [Streptantibioticus cattleyicolor NRRL 8057 = DSM 46488]MYS58779.1 GNAT family N-acetyltransferase [Streptomyces sp. SID5468]CCB74467.1 conserved protein of unknown function [Streptantibioticus cattleyicolor NRRL 8057 = DSM 46488]
MTTDLRVLEPEHWDHWYGRLERAFGGADDAEERALWRDLTEFERSLAVWDGGEVVGTAGAFSFQVSVPGGAAVPAAGVTMVSVQATHRRRGVLTSMMRRLLDDVRGRGEPLAVLTASEPGIYGRFGYGLATRQMRIEPDTDRVRVLAPPEADGVRLRVADPREAVDACEAVYARRVPLRPGAPVRPPGWEHLPLLTGQWRREGAGELLCVLAERDGEVTGYARYAVSPAWEFTGPRGAVLLRDLEALDPVTCAALWRYLFSVDLTSSVRAGNRPVDDPLLHLVSDVRRCDVRVRDGMFLRVVEVGAALTARAYAAPVDVVLEVTDPFCPWNEGRWRLSGDAKGASCERTGDAADLVVGATELGSLHLGGVSAAGLAAAGRIREVRAGALAELETAFHSPLAPWLPHGF